MTATPAAMTPDSGGEVGRSCARVEADRRPGQQESERAQGDCGRDDGHDRHLAHVDAVHGDRLVERRDRHSRLADDAVPHVDELGHGLKEEGDREGRHEHYRRRLTPKRPEHDAIHRERRRDDDREADGHAPGHRPGRRERQRVRADHDQLPVGEVHEAQDAEDEPDADRHQRVDGAQADGVHQRLGVYEGEHRHQAR
jgi:hypothetical protein